ncbi:hypothetical protein CK203_030273 [Vitis vinifera]|uniref:DUF4283 domain-containing protein n=1 Tax=Vitis vinifera TaxID=29760 RepID=A0A438I571_VITVI|nr:hypothetical protein CK203_030273 [Vitis vinifera]
MDNFNHRQCSYNLQGESNQQSNLMIGRWRVRWRGGGEEERSASQIRRKESRFTVESKEFEIAVEDRRGKIQGCIVEKKGGASSWVRLGAESLTFFLEGLNLCIKGEKETRWGREWKEQGRVYSMIRGTNRAGGFIRLGVSDVEGKRFCIFVQEAVGIRGGGRSWAEKLKQVLGFFGKNPEKYKGKAVEKVAMEDRMHQCWRDGPGGEDDIEKWGKFWAKSWDLKGNLGLAKLNKRKALLEFEDLEEARRVISSGSCAWEGTQVSPEILRRVGDACGGFITADENTRSMRDLQWARILVKWGGEARPNVLEIEGEEESYVVTLWWECWPVLRRKCRDEADRHSREVRGKEDSHAGQRVMKGWGSGRLEMLHSSDDGMVLQGVGSGRVENSPDLSPTTCNWVSSGEMKSLSPIAGPKETRREGGLSLMFGSMDLKNKGEAASDAGPDAGPSEVVGCYPKGPASSLVQLTNKGLLCSKACTQQLDQGGTIREGPNSLAVQEVTGLILKWSAPSYPPEAELFVARENEDTRKLQGG